MEGRVVVPLCALPLGKTTMDEFALTLSFGWDVTGFVFQRVAECDFLIICTLLRRLSRESHGRLSDLGLYDQAARIISTG